MKEQLISMYIDEELNIDEKVEFVETVHSEKSFRDEAVLLLRQEKWIRSDPAWDRPRVSCGACAWWVKSLFRPMGFFASGVAVALMILFLSAQGRGTGPMSHRFVLYQPDAVQAEIAGSFTGWSPVPMRRAGAGGYWEIVLDLPEGVHRFSYILDQTVRTADPTIPAREFDDFGGQNSIFEVKKTI